MVEGQEGVSWEDWLALAATCESAGISGLYRSDHYTSFTHPDERGGLDAWASLSALAAVTTSLRLGTLVSPVGFRSAGMLAKLVASAGEISGGRVELGLGAGWFEDEFRAFGFPFPSLRERYVALEETLEVLDSLLRRPAEPTTFAGRYVTVTGCRILPPVPPPRIILGGDAGPKSASLAARWADEYNLLEVSPELGHRATPGARGSVSSLRARSRHAGSLDDDQHGRRARPWRGPGSGWSGHRQDRGCPERRRVPRGQGR